jgi:hypothetical protein
MLFIDLILPHHLSNDIPMDERSKFILQHMDVLKMIRNSLVTCCLK